MQLNETEGKLIAGLVNDPAYILLIEKIQALVDTLTNKIHVAPLSASSEIIPIWKALRTVYIELKNTPQEVVEWLEQLRASKDKFDFELPQHIKTQNQLQQFMKELENQRDRSDEAQSPAQLFNNAKPNPNSFGNII